MGAEVETAARPSAERVARSASSSVSMGAQLAQAQAFLAEERKARAAERAAATAQYQQVLGLLSGYEAALATAQGASIPDASLGPVSTLIQSLHATIDIQRAALGDDMSVVYYARVVEAAHAYWDLQTEYGRDFKVAPGPSQSDTALGIHDSGADAGPWSLFYGQDGRLTGVLSEDFTRDVLLRVEGDFADDADRLAYACWLRDALMRDGNRTGPGQLSTCLKSLHNCYQEFIGICDAAEPALGLLQGYVDLLDAHLAGGARADSPLHEDRRILAEAVTALGGVVGRAKDCATPKSPD